eukprot:3941718-Alexandrium_andersonii.AAC.1
MVDLAQATGAPRLGVVPVASGPAWGRVQKALFLLAAGEGIRRRARSPGALWALLHGGSMPRPL